MKKILFILISIMFVCVGMSCAGVGKSDTNDVNETNDAKNEDVNESDNNDTEEFVDDFVFTGKEVNYVTEIPLPKKELEEEDSFIAVKNMKSGINFGNNLDSTSFTEGGDIGWIVQWGDGTPKAWETAWGQPVVRKRVIQSIKYRGFNAIRVPVTWAEHIDENNQIDDAWMARVKNVVAMVLEEDMYCLVNTHHDGGTGGWVKASTTYYNKYKERYEAVYTRIANEFKDCGEKLILCGTNEMIANNNWGDGSKDSLEAVNKWNQLFVDTVRATGGNNAKRNLMVGTYCCSGSERNLSGFERPDDIDGNHLILEIHCYSPQDFTWETASWLPNWTTEWKPYMEVALDDEFSRIKRYADKNNMPVILGEWGTLSRRFPGKDDKTGKQKWKATTDSEGAKFTEYFIKKSYEKGFCSFYWDSAELIDRRNGAVKSPLMIQGIMNGVNGVSAE